MAVDKEAIMFLSRVYSYYFNCNFPLCYVYPALTRYLSILFLNILTLLACTLSSDNLFQTLMVLCENENFLTSNLLWMQIMFHIPEFARKERNLHYDLVHITTVWVSRLVLDHEIAVIRTSR